MDLPKKNELVPLAKIREICQFYGLASLWQKIENDPPVKPFKVTAARCGLTPIRV